MGLLVSKIVGVVLALVGLAIATTSPIVNHGLSWTAVHVGQGVHTVEALWHEGKKAAR